jgi:hypothetical protein
MTKRIMPRITGNHAGKWGPTLSRLMQLLDWAAKKRSQEYTWRTDEFTGGDSLLTDARVRNMLVDIKWPAIRFIRTLLILSPNKDLAVGSST